MKMSEFCIFSRFDLILKFAVIHHFCNENVNNYLTIKFFSSQLLSDKETFEFEMVKKRKKVFKKHSPIKFGKNDR